MLRLRRIMALGATASALIILTGCPGTAAPVDTSQRVLVETGRALAIIDRGVAGGIGQAAEAARRGLPARVVAECTAEEDRVECGMELYRRTMDPWYRTTAALEAAHGTLQAWEQANDAWRVSGRRPPDWEEVVCRPVGTMATTIVELLREIDIDVPPRWAALASYGDDLCQLGVTISELVAPEQRVVGGDGGAAVE